jgi:Ca2+-transporting ATPase
MMTNRSWTSTIGKILRAPNTALWWVTGGAVVFLGLVLNITVLRGIFRFSVIHPVDVAICVPAGISSIIWFELFKLFSRVKDKNTKLN